MTTPRTREALRQLAELPDWLTRLADSMDSNQRTADLYMQEICGLRQWAALLASLPVRPEQQDEKDLASRGPGFPESAHGDLPRRNEGDK